MHHHHGPPGPGFGPPPPRPGFGPPPSRGPCFGPPPPRPPPRHGPVCCCIIF